MRRKEIVFVCVAVFSAFLIVAADEASDGELVDDDAEQKITTADIPQKIPSDGSVIDDDVEHEIPTPQIPEKIPSDASLINDEAEHEIPTTQIPEKIPNDKELNDDQGEREMAATEPPKKIFNVKCASPPEIEGSIAPQVEGDEHAIGSSVSYSCNYGYVSRNSVRHISTCVLNRTSGRAEWTVPEIACIPRSCGDPGYVNNGRRIGSLFTFPNKVAFECWEGYRIVGMKERYCQAGGEWSGRLPYCEPILCGVPPDPTHGEAIYSSLEFSSELTYKCNPGFMVTHKETRYCDEDGTWSGQAPECIETRCPKPVAPEYGQVHFTGDPKVGSIATYSCDPGLKLQGASTTKCLNTGQWTFGPPACLSSCVVPTVENGEMGKIFVRQITRWKTEKIFTPLSAGEHVDHNEVLHFNCNADFAIVEGDTILKDVPIAVTCNDAKWSRDLRCKKTSCLGVVPPEIKRGKAIISGTHHGHTIWYQCNDHRDKKIEGNVTCHFGTWIGNPPQCINSASASCDANDLGFPGLVKPVERVESFIVACKNGYRLSTSAKIIACDGGKWNITEDPCPLENEGDPERSRNEMVAPSQINVEDKPPPDHRPTNRPTNRPECHCTYVGTRFHVQASVGPRTLKDGDRVRKGRTVTLSCKGPRMLTWDNGFRLYGNASMTCTTCRRWEVADIPACTLLERGGPFIVLDDSLEIQPGGSVEVKLKQPITLHCASTYNYPHWNFRGSLVRDVQYSTQISGDGLVHYFSSIHISETSNDNAGLYECHFRPMTLFRHTVVNVTVKENNCPPLAANPFVTYTNGNRVGSRATFRCPENAVVDGNRQIVCRDDGTWSSPEPLCRVTSCVPFPFVANPRVSYSDGHAFGSTATFSCSASTKLVGSAVSECRRDGNWTNPAPICLKKTTCEWFARTSGLKVEYSNSNFEGSIASFSCSSQKVLNGDSFAKCLENGSWSHPKPSCEGECLIDVLSTSVPQNVVPDLRTVPGDRVPFGSPVPLLCDGKLIPVGNSTAVCGQEGRWKIGNFQCELRCLLDLEPSSRLLVDPLKESYRFGESIILGCPEGEKTSKDVQLLMCYGPNGWSEPLPKCVPK